MKMKKNMHQSILSEKEFSLLASLAKKILWKDLTSRRRLQQEHKVNITPANFYSDIPLIDDIENSFEYEEAEMPPYVKLFDKEALLRFCENLLPHTRSFDPPIAGNIESPDGFFWENPAFSHMDAMAYYSMIRHYKPTQILEIGSGFSTLVADMALKENGFGELILIEPYPKKFLKNLDSVKTIIEKKVQDISVLELVELVESSDFWFIDSTHTVKIGSDCLYIYLKVMPEIQSDTIIHTHDVCLPDGIDHQKALDKHIYWTEQYLLYAYLLNNKNAEILFGSHYTHKYLPDMARKMMHSWDKTYGGSLWYRVNRNKS